MVSLIVQINISPVIFPGICLHGSGFLSYLSLARAAAAAAAAVAAAAAAESEGPVLHLAVHRPRRLHLYQAQEWLRQPPQNLPPPVSVLAVRRDCLR